MINHLIEQTNEVEYKLRLDKCLLYYFEFRLFLVCVFIPQPFVRMLGRFIQAVLVSCT